FPCRFIFEIGNSSQESRPALSNSMQRPQLGQSVSLPLEMGTAQLPSRQQQPPQQTELEVVPGRESLAGYDHSQVPVQPVTAAGPEHSKTLEKPETLFNQERDPRFSEIYSSISTDQSKAIPASTVPANQPLFTQGNTFTPSRPAESFRSSSMVPPVNIIQQQPSSAGRILAQISRHSNPAQVSGTNWAPGTRPAFTAQQVASQTVKTRPPSFSMGTFQGTPSSFSPMTAPGSTASPTGAAYPNLASRGTGF
ncbi:PREDICTED: aryl hydrocarbon receptor nuclear translocator-like, partial [Mesitornis unicolor]|uniref:aryl hydrocarbon receptor nuclear translocator-like n=1 Tax=Mesitornis unicolor TaxID=54374 RepID=UPI00052834EE